MVNADSKTPNSPKRNKNENIQNGQQIIQSQRSQENEEKGYCCVSYAQSTDLAMKVFLQIINHLLVALLI